MKAVLIVIALMAQLLSAALPAGAMVPLERGPASHAADDPFPSLMEGVVFVDVDHNTYTDYEEPQLLDVTLVLSGTDDLGQPVLLTTTTNVDGWPYFSLEVARPGTYTLGIAGLADFALEAAYLDDVPQPDPAAISLIFEAESYHNARFSVWPRGLTGQVYRDSNANSQRDPAEVSGAMGVPIHVTGQTPAGAVMSDTTTYGNGFWYATGLASGVYTVSVELSDFYFTAGAQPGSLGGTVISDTAIGGITYTAGLTSTGYDVGFWYGGYLFGAAWNDLNGDGARTLDEPLLGGLPISLTGVSMRGNSVSLTTTSSPALIYSNANWQISEIPPGVYTLTAAPPPALLDGPDYAGNLGGVVSANAIAQIAFPMGATGVNYNFTAVPAMLRGRVFYDQNLSGLWDAGESSPSNVSVRLQNSDGTYSQTTQTSGGLFRFLNPPAGVYTLTELFGDPSVFDGAESIGTGGGYVAANDVIAGIVFSGTVVDGYGFAEVLPASLSGAVYEERGLSPRFQSYPDDDLPLTGITITLAGTDFAGAAVLTTTLTDYAGVWRFNALKPGVFTVTQTPPSGAIDGPELIGYGTTSATVFANDVYAITLMPGDAGQAFDFVELPAGLRGTVHDDRNDNGFHDAGDLGISSAQVQATGTTITGTLITQTAYADSLGRFAFVALPAGTYTLTEAQPSFYLDSDDAIGAAGGSIITNDVIAGIVYSPALYAGGYRFGELYPAIVNGSVYLDRNGNGVADVGESGLGGVSLYLSGVTRRGGQYYTMTTAANGAFSFSTVRAGVYTLREAQPAGYADGADTGPASPAAGIVGNDIVTEITLAGASNLSYYYFGEQLAGIEGVVFIDSNMDGDSAGEIGLSNVAITLGGRTITGFNVLTGTFTDFQGRFNFRGLLTGTYTVTESQPASYLGAPLFDFLDIPGTSGGITNTRNVISGIPFFPGVNASGYGFAEVRPAQLGGLVGVDTNGDGVYGSTEPGLGGVPILLSGMTYSGATYSRVQTSAASSGLVSFITVPPGVYTVTEQQPSGFGDGSAVAGQFATFPGVVVGANTIGGIRLGSSDYARVYQFAESVIGVSGIVFQDLDNNGIRAGGEPGIGGVVISLTSAAVQTTTSNTYGEYYFTGLAAGQYTLTEAQPSAYLDGKDAPLASVIAADALSLAYTGTSVITGFLFGELPPAKVRGYIFYDTNGDGVKQPAETYISNVTVVLTGTDDLGGNVRLTSTTGANFSFLNLRPGAYALAEQQPEGYTDGIDTAPSNGVADGDDGIANIVLAVGQDAFGYAFAEKRTGLSGYVFVDANNNGVKDVGEAGIGSTLVILTGTTSLGAPVARNAFSSVFGFYAFGDLAAGDYRVSIVRPLDRLDGREQLGSLGGTISGDAFQVAYGAGQFGTDYNFGLLAPAQIAGVVFNDINRSLSLDNDDERLGLVQIVLTGTDDISQTVWLTRGTDANGQFSFTGLRPGLYALNEQQPAGYSDGPELTNGNGITDGLDAIRGIVVAPGQAVFNLYFTERQTGVGGYVYVDANNNGVKDTAGAGEAGIFDVQVILSGTTQGGQPVLRTSQTNANGFYFFGDLISGTYQLGEVQPGGYLDGKDAAGALGGSVAPPGQDAISFAYDGESFASGYTFGEILPARIGGYVFYDLDDDGIMDANSCPLYDPYCDHDDQGIETAIGSGVSLVLTGTNDLTQTVWLTEATTTGGRFEFSGLRPGAYTLIELQRDVDVDGLDSARGAAITATVSNDRIFGIVLPVGGTAGAQFGEHPSIMGRVYRDDDDNAAYDPSPTCDINGDQGIGNVNVTINGIDIYNNAVNRNFAAIGGQARDCDYGLFYFGGLVTGTYSLIETQPAGYTDGAETIGTGGGLTTTNDVFSRIVFTPGTVLTGYLFGESRATIGGNVYLDANGNGLRDQSEGGLLSLSRIWLSGRNDQGQTVSQSLSVYGAYLFTGLRPGAYTLTQFQPEGYTDGAEQLGTGAGGVIGGNDRFVNLQLTRNAAGENYNFGETIAASIRGRVAYVTTPGAGANSGVGLAGVSVALRGPGGLLTSTFSDMGGYYEFGGLAPGGYTITQASMPPGYQPFPPMACGSGSVNAPALSIEGIALAFGSSLSGCNFRVGPVISGTVWLDHNTNGVFDELPGDGLSGVQIRLVGQITEGATVTKTTYTSGGRFYFGGVLTGTYRLEEVQPSPYLDGADVLCASGGGCVTGGAPITNDVFGGIVYTPGLVYGGYGFAELRRADLSGLTYWDKDDNGIPSVTSGPDSYINASIVVDGIDDLGAGVRITLTGSPFHFSLRPGVYTLTQQQPYGYTDWVDAVGNHGGILANDQFSHISLGWGDIAGGYAFGERRIGVVGRVFGDRDNTGYYDPPPDGGDFGIAGARVWLSGTSELAQAVLLSTTTGTGGVFSFDNPPAGVYALIEEQPVGYSDGKDSAGGNGVALNDRIEGIVLGARSFGEGYGFGELVPSTLAGYVYIDLNRNGYREGGEPGIKGVALTLSGTTALGAPVLAITTTNAAGLYRFTSIANGVYDVFETQPDAVDGADRAGIGAGGIAFDDAIAGLVFNQSIDAVNYTFGEQQSGLSGYVRAEDGDPISPVTIRLRGIDLNGAGVNRSIKTNTSGYFGFDVLPGGYWLEETQPYGYLESGASVGTAGGTLSGTNVITGIVLAAGGAGSDYIFREHAPLALELADAMELSRTLITGAWLDVDGSNKAGVGRARIGEFPVQGGTVAYLGTGNMVFADQPNTNPNTFGLGDYATLVFTLTTPDATCMTLDFAFLSEEFPEFVGSQFNDSFDAFWNGVPFARDGQGNRISINTVFGASAANAAGSTYDGATPRLRAQMEITPFATSVLSFTLRDVTDTAYDSAVLIDRVRFTKPGGRGCDPGARLPAGISLRQGVSTQSALACASPDTLRAALYAEVYTCIHVENTGDVTLTAHSLTDTYFGGLLNGFPLSLPPGGTYDLIQASTVTRSVVHTATWSAGNPAISGTGTISAGASASLILDLPDPGGATVIAGSGAVTAGRAISVAVLITGVADLGGFEFKLSFDPAVISLTRVTAGPLLGSTGRSVIALGTERGTGYARFGLGSLGGAAGASGEGVLAWVEFVALAPGNSALALSQVLVANTGGQSVTPVPQNGSVEVIPRPRAMLPRLLR